MKITRELLPFETKEGLEFIDITEKVEEAVERAKTENGQVLVFVKHTTAAIKLQENEPLLIEDFKRTLGKIADCQEDFRHNDFSVRTVHMNEDECPNGHAHCQHLFLGTSETIPVVEGKMDLGQWQRIFLIELDHPRKREVVVQIMGN